MVKIILKFLSAKNNAVVYICDPGEHKGKARARKFKSWYEGFKKHSNSILHFTSDAEADGIKLYTALLIHKDNPLKDRFIKAFLDLVENDDE